MPTTYVAVDVETTGLDPDNDAIIEVAAIAFREDEILEEFRSLVNPHRPVPPSITRLTGITEEMVAEAPSMFSLRARLRNIIGDNPLVGHNVGFDVGFLNAERLGIGNHRLDTLTLATILVANAGRYNLENLVRHLDLSDPAGGQVHRALADATQTVELFLVLWQRALALTWQQLEEIVQAGQNLGWPETLFFQQALAEKARGAFEEGSRQHGRLPRLFTPPKLSGRSLVAAEDPQPLDVQVITGMLQPGGNLSRVFPGFEYRPQQIEMTEVVATAFNEGRQVLVEAGTGTGKSIGYLLPAAFWAYENGRRVVISTNTINLQDQLIHKDIPELQKVLPFELRAAVRKGRRNYLCTRLFQQMRHSGPNSADEMVLYARILLWLPHTEVGDVAELGLRTPGERLAWAKLNGENATCTAEHCMQENCPLHLARRRAEQAHLVIVNHSLLLSDVANEGHILPEFRDLIIDEAHHLEAAVTDGLSFRADKRFLRTILDEIIKPRAGLVADLQNRARTALPQVLSSTIDEFADTLRGEAQAAAMRLDEFFTTLDYFMQGQVKKRSQFAQQVRLIPPVRSHADFEEVQLSWENLDRYLKTIVAGLGKLAGAIDDVTHSHDIEDAEDLRVALASSGRTLEETRVTINAILIEPHPDVIYWLELFKEYISIHAAPLHIGPLVEQHVFHAKETVILTSATLRTASARAYGKADFSYVRDRLHANEVDELAVGSPFDYKNSTLLYLVTDIPEPNQPGYQRYLDAAVIDVATALKGRTMVLFTSYGQLIQTMRGVEGPLSEAGITTLAQAQGMSRQQLLEQFKAQDSRSVLLGTRSFWEGVDVPGPALQALLITKFPFDVPSDPVFAARAETFDNSFFQYSVPEAVLRFRQGFGRLIRRQNDEGVVVVLDKRILTKRYGQAFLDALPECTVLRQRSGRLGELALRWLNREKNHSR